MWFLSLKKVWKECDYDESLQFACDTEGRMNGHVKSMCFLHLMESAAGRCDYWHFFDSKNEKLFNPAASFSCFRFILTVFDSL